MLGEGPRARWEWRLEGGSDLYKATQLKRRPAEALAAAAVSHMAYSKMGDSEKGRKDEKIGREGGREGGRDGG